MNRRHLHLTLALSVCAMALPSAAAAQQIPRLENLTEKQQKLLLGHLDRGRTLYENGEFVDALDAFQDAYTIFPHPDVLYRVAECQEKMGDDADAIANYKKFLRQSPDAPERKRIEGVISVLERRLAKRQEARVYVISEPPGARAFLGSVDLGPTPVGIPVTPGDYDIRVELDGYNKIAENVTISPGKTLELRYKLVPEAAASGGGQGGGFVLAPAGPGASPVDGMLANPITPWVVGGTGALSLIGSIFFWSASSSAGQQVDAYDAERRERLRPDDYDDLVGARNGFGTAGVVTTTLGLALVGGGVALYLLHQDMPDSGGEDEVAPPSEGSAPPATVFAPLIGPDSAGVQVFATF